MTQSPELLPLLLQTQAMVTDWCGHQQANVNESLNERPIANDGESLPHHLFSHPFDRDFEVGEWERVSDSPVIAKTTGRKMTRTTVNVECDDVDDGVTFPFQVSAIGVMFSMICGDDDHQLIENASVNVKHERAFVHFYADELVQIEKTPARGETTHQYHYYHHRDHDHHRRPLQSNRHAMCAHAVTGHSICVPHVVDRRHSSMQPLHSSHHCR